MKIHKAYKTELAPNRTQEILFRKACGTARFAWNWGLARRIEEYKATGKSSNAIEQHRQLTALKAVEFPWMYDVSKCAPHEALRNLDRAYTNFFRRVNNGEKPGFPKFKSKYSSRQSFHLMGSIHVESHRICLPRIGWVKLKEQGYVPKDNKIFSAVVSIKADRWFVSVIVEEEITPENNLNGNTIGLDLGIAKLATTSDGIVFQNPKVLERNLKKLARLQRQMAKQTKGSSNKNKTKLKIQRLCCRINCIRQDATHQMTTAVVKTKPRLVVIEDLNVKGMLGNRRLSRSVSDAAFGEIRRQLEYKAKWNGFELVVADRWFPSSKTCSGCGHIKADLKLSDRVFACPACGLEMDRDLNAAINLKNYHTGSSPGIHACGDGIGKRPSSKQELKTIRENIA